MDSTVSKDSRDMQFVIFGPTEHFKCILQVAAYLKEF
jgi:hypothetical protein